ncbi:MAG TPA: hypothetical protein VJM08_07525 [Anaerolineales bacterium]|nr:hypothetical protein [Anaerolineales bacterium]
MNRFPNFGLLVLLFLTACGSIPGLNPTATPVPTQTLQPTLTPSPTNTATPVPTATPDITATAGAKATETADSILDELDLLLADTDIPYKEGHLAWQQTKPLTINLSGPDDQVLPINEELTAGDFILKSDVTWNASGIIICGAVFRSEADLERGKQYRFLFLRLSGLPAWEIDVFEFGQYKNSPTDTKFSGAIDQGNGATNQFVIVARDDQFNLYLNQNHEGRFFDYSKQRTQGSFAFLAFQDSGKGSCEFENSWVWSLD